MKKTKIIATLGPATATDEKVKQLRQAGVSIFRINMSHGEPEQWKQYVERVRRVCPRTSVLVDTKGPELRLLQVSDQMVVTKGDDFTFSFKPHADMPYVNHSVSVRSGQVVLIDDGAVVVRVSRVEGDIVHCIVEDGGPITNKRKVTIPGSLLSLPVVDEQDRKDLQAALALGVDGVAASFVQSADDVRKVRAIVGDDVMLIAKIETRSGVEHIDEIIEETDGIMVARGDLGVDLPLEDVPGIQKNIIEKCITTSTSVIVATQMLESMIHNSRPTRAEASDVANAILDGTDCIMLSAETAVGDFPIEAVSVMNRIAVATESRYKTHLSRVPGGKMDVATAIANAVYDLSQNVEVDAIVSATASGFTARLVSRFRPDTRIVGVAHDDHVARKLQFSWGVHPCVFETEVSGAQHTVLEAVKSALHAGLIDKDEVVIATGGVDTAEKGSTNLIEIHHVREFLEFHGH